MTRIERERRTVGQMVRLYCRHHHGPAADGLCQKCDELLSYAHARLERCRFGERKPTCRCCPVHCYRPDMKRRISAVMRWAGPRMLLHHPTAALRHLVADVWKRELRPRLARLGIDFLKTDSI